MNTNQFLPISYEMIETGPTNFVGFRYGVCLLITILKYYRKECFYGLALYLLKLKAFFVLGVVAVASQFTYVFIDNKIIV
jgi:hypothetical protein